MRKVVILILVVMVVLCSASFRTREQVNACYSVNAVEAASLEVSEVGRRNNAVVEKGKVVSCQGAILNEKVMIPEIDLTEVINEESELETTEAWAEFRKKMAGIGVEVPAGMTLEWIKEHLDLFYTDDEIIFTTKIVQAEDLIAYSDTICFGAF